MGGFTRPGACEKMERQSCERVHFVEARVHRELKFRWAMAFVALTLAACDKAPPPNAAPKPASRYPAHWWTSVSKEGAPDWEILPQEAKPGEVILSKRNELGLLSNFAATPFEYRGKRYASLEGFWQMMKYPEGPDDPRAKFPGIEWKLTRDEVAEMTAFDAKRAGDLASRNMDKMGIDWVTFEGKQMPYKPVEPGEHYRLIDRGDASQGAAESRGEAGALVDWRSGAEARSSPGKRCCQPRGDTTIF